MKMRNLLAASVCVLALGSNVATAETFKWAFQGDVQSLDPHGLNETFTLGYLGNVYEGLTAYDQDLQLQPALAESWENTSPTTWVFKLRQGVKFHDGSDFTADDVIFSWKRSLTDGSDMKGYGAKMADIKKIDDHTVELVTPAPNPILPRELVFLYMMDQGWSEKHGASEATSPKAADSTATYAAQNANGTGPFILTERQPDVRSKFTRFDDYWQDIPTNVTEVEFTPVSQDATRVAALISGELDLVYPIPVQDWTRLEEAEGVRPLTGPEARTIFLGMDQWRDELLYSSVKGKNPLKDKRVREAMAHAIDLNAIDEKIMRGAAVPAGILIAPEINGFDAAMNTPYDYNLEKSKQLLAEAGYPDGFELGMDCPNNRYVNDEKICQAVVGLLARAGIKVDLNAQPKSKYFAKVSPQNDNDTSFYLLGWTPGTIDVHNVLFNLMSSFDTEVNSGQFNYGRYSNPRIDAITQEVEKETDITKRQALIAEAFSILREDVGYLPLHQQPLSWGVREGVTVAQRADNVLDLRSVVIEK
ncbi:ABC transporter substrate-binding protein [Kiloniella laminariae]|uniref:ABC transporter substrate-binding protein n=1 Tax=Kiloniella laminariae TaxID=454162 RepID=A0ABT4LH63_9PROT|nr:ABC transporter substrate-binding protein [Kiloniella laminariae]MCZ4280443.1 ABC transporter substrate-binding protein [Kiloniella laminariae]